MTPRPLSALLARLIWLCMAPLLLLALWLAWDTLRHREAMHVSEGENLAGNVAESIDQFLRARTNALHLLAQSPVIDDPQRWPELYAQAQGYRTGFGGHLIFADHDRQMLFITRLPFGAALPRLPDAKGRTAALLALESGTPQVGDRVIAPTTQQVAWMEPPPNPLAVPTELTAAESGDMHLPAAIDWVIAGIPGFRPPQTPR